MKEKRKGFTLIELLVVVAIIAILAAMLLPALSQARERARQAVCMSNLKQAAGACYMYMDDYNEYIFYPSARWCWALVNSGNYMTSKKGTGTYSNKIFICPSMEKTTTPFSFTGSSAHYSSTVTVNSHYGMNNGIWGAKLSMIKNSHSNTAFISETRNASTGQAGYYFGYYAPNYYLPTIEAAPHNKGINMMWLDGHVSWMPLPVPTWAQDPVFWYKRSY